MEGISGFVVWSSGKTSVRLASNAVHSAVPWLISRNTKGDVSRKVYRRDGSAKVKLLPIDEVKKLASGTQTRRRMSRRSKSLSNSSSTFLKKICSSKSLVKKKTAKDGCHHEQTSGAVHIKTPSCSILFLGGSSSNAPKLSSSLEDKTWKVGHASKSNSFQPATSELIKTKAYGKNSVYWERLVWEDGPADSEYHGNDSSSASTVANRPKTGSADQADCWNHHKGSTLKIIKR